MSDLKNKIQSPLVKAVLALDEYFSELDRVGTKIGSMELKSEFDFEHAQRLLKRFAECGEGVSTEVTNLSTQLNEARARAETIAQAVSARAEQLSARKTEQQKKMDEFRELGDQVRELSVQMAQLRRPEGDVLTNDDRVALGARLAEFESQLNPLIEKAQSLRKDARNSRMRILEQNADSLTQTLQVIRQKLGSLNLPNPLVQ